MHENVVGLHRRSAVGESFEETLREQSRPTQETRKPRLKRCNELKARDFWKVFLWIRQSTVRKFRQLRTWLLTLVESERLGLLGWGFLFFLPCVIDLTWTFLYFAERQADIEVAGGQCENPENLTSPAYETPRSNPIWATQVTFAFFSFFIWMPFRILYAGSRKFRTVLDVIVLVDLLTAVPFIVSVFVRSMQNLYIPSFFRVWISRFQLGFIVKDSKLSGEVFLFCAAIFASGITMIACFEWSQNNFPVGFGVLGSQEPASYSCTTFLSSAYWLIVTISTVGYGDVTPLTNVARVVTLVCILLFVVLLPYGVDRISGFFKRSRDLRHQRFTSRAQESHIVVHGYLDSHVLNHTLYYFDPMRRTRRVERRKRSSRFSSPFVSVSHRKENDSKAEEEPEPQFADHVVLLSDNSLTEDMIRQTDLGYAKSFVSVLEGSLLSTYDLARCKLKHASAVFILPVLHTYTDAKVQSSIGSTHVGSFLWLKEISSPDDFDAVLSYTGKISRTADARNRLYSRDYPTLLRAWSASEKMSSEQLTIVVLFHQCNQKYLLDRFYQPEDEEGAIETFHQRAIREYPNLRDKLDRQLYTLCIDSFQQEVLAASCLVPGLSTLLTNLFIGEDRTMPTGLGTSKTEETDTSDSSSGCKPSPYTDRKRCPCERFSSIKDVIATYAKGLENELEIMEVDGENPYIGQPALQVWTHFYQTFNIVVLAMVARDDFEMKVKAVEGQSGAWDLPLGLSAERKVSQGDRLVLVGRGIDFDRAFSFEEAGEPQPPMSEDDELQDESNGVELGNNGALGQSEADLEVDVEATREASDAVVELRPMDSESTSRMQRNDSTDGSINGAEPRAAMPFGKFQNAASIRRIVENERMEEGQLVAGSDAAAGKDVGGVSPSPGPRGPTPQAETRANSNKPQEVVWYSNTTKRVLRGGFDLRGHFIVCAPPDMSIVYFVMAIRRNKSREKQPILWLVDQPPNTFVWHQLQARVGGISWMLGDSCSEQDLIAAGIEKASDIVLLSEYFDNYIPEASGSSEPVESADIDRYVIQSHRAVKMLIIAMGLTHLRVHTHINDPINARYLHESLWHKFLYMESGFSQFRAQDPHKKTQDIEKKWSWLWKSRKSKNAEIERRIDELRKISFTEWPVLFDESYAAGEIWSTASFFFILFSGLIGGTGTVIWDVLMIVLMSCGKESDADEQTTHGLRLVPVPEECQGKCYESVFLYFLQRKAVSLGLFVRYAHGHNTKEFAKPAVVLNPKKSTIVFPCDYVYVLGGKGSL